MSTAVAEKPETQVARPLKVLVPLIREDLAAAEKAGIPYYRAAGEKLLEAKDQLNHGEFQSWVDRNLGISKQQAARYMRLAEETTSKSIARGTFTSIRDFERQTGRSTGTGKTSWHEPVKEALDRAANIRNLHEESLKREAEREAQRRLALQLIDIGFKALASQLHPDKGGSKEAMTRLNAVRDRLKMHA